VIVLLDGENLIIETSEGDRAFSIRPESALPDELRAAEAWAAAKGTPVSVAFEPGEDGELRVVETYQYIGLAVNPGLTDADFEPDTYGL
jgi:hypothetical protein